MIKGKSFQPGASYLARSPRNCASSPRRFPCLCPFPHEDSFLRPNGRAGCQSCRLCCIWSSNPEIMKSCLELKNIWSTIKDAPPDVSDLVEELSQLACILETLHQQHDVFSRFAPTSSTWEAPLRRCAAVASDLEAVALDLKAKLKQSETRGSVKKLLKIDTVVKRRGRLASARTNLSLVQSALMT
jgi:hypothetical protein